MNSLKNAAVILLMIGVLYGVYVTLNQPEAPPPREMPPHELAALGPPQVEMAAPLPAPPLAVPGPSSAPAVAVAAIAPPAETPASLASPEIESPASAASVPSPPPVEAPPARSRGGAFGGAAPHDNSPAADESMPARQSAYQRTETPATELPAGSGDSASARGSSSAEAAAASSSAPAPSRSPALTAYAFRRDWQEAERLIQDQKFRSALALLTPYYQSPELAAEDVSQLNRWLDALAAKVIYSREHVLAESYKVQRGDTLPRIAERYKVPYQLLQNINGVRDPSILVPGTELKVIPGPLRAEVDLARNELTVFLNDLYAGRFPFSLGDQPPQPGTYHVIEKSRDRNYYGRDGRVINGADPQNPYGGWWLDLGNEVSIHGSPRSSAGGAERWGCISLSPQDAQDVYGILSFGSQVTIRR